MFHSKWPRVLSGHSFSYCASSGGQRLLAAIDIDDPAGELDLEVVALRRELDRAAILGDRLVVLAHALERLTAARDDLDAARRIAAEQLLGGGVALERDVALAGGEHRVAALDPQLRVRADRDRGTA